ncbi:MAG: nitrate reductase molybdenum cofactor assembly chaperone [Streptococcaceae bacterium]|jgi:nitrate reductase delta subunit|nr:nitrate reductase molybdenum cofactor assembly chaperone [Streptococcaceae bacterium]
MANRVLKSMQSNSTVGFGVIEVEKLRDLQPAFGVLAELLDFPEENISDEKVLELFPKIPEKAEVTSACSKLSEMALTSLQEHYVELFELNKSLTLYMTYYKLTDSRERGTVMAKLKLLYEMFGLSLDNAELTDYLPTMLEFLAMLDTSDLMEGSSALTDLEFLFNVLEDGTYEVLQKSSDLTDEPYVALLRVTRDLLKKCIKNVA